MEDLRPNARRAKTAIVLIWIVLGLNVIMLISEYFQYRLLQRVETGGLLEEGEAEINDLRQQALGILYLIVFIISAVTFIQWFRRAYYNLHTRVSNLQYSEGWAAGGWFVPIISLYYPYRIMKELYSETENILSNNLEQYVAKTTTKFVGWWWAFWIIDNFFGQIVFRMSRHADTVSEIINQTEMSMVSDAFGIPVALLAIKVIKDYSSIEPLLFELKNKEVSTEITSEGTSPIV